MSYQVLARKYRPANFQELEGQTHVLQALVNALDNERLHHAYLFTGTRGVGKTTIARILARCLNCETGVTSTPCGTCNTCMEISEGRSVDLIEVDAASRTGVDDMRELLDNVQYMPTSSRFKIYLIDEVHMLSKSSFNAMLKTLEEPPEHVKFLFATTDPKKLPITVLSRCLQFNLKNLSPEQIVRYLGQVLRQEEIEFEESALWQLGHAADGSMRDALSLTDQAISFGGNAVAEGAVTSMLGSIDRSAVFEMLDYVARADGTRLLQRVAELADFAPDFAALLDDILSVLHRIAVAHAVPDGLDNAQGDRELVLAAAKQISAEHVQLLYQIALIGQRDLPLAPTPRTGFEMVLLRMMSFSPGGNGSAAVFNDGNVSQTSGPAKDAPVKNSVAGTASSPIAELLSAINEQGGNKEQVRSGSEKAEMQLIPEPTPEPTPDRDSPPTSKSNSATEVAHQSTAPETESPVIAVLQQALETKPQASSAQTDSIIESSESPSVLANPQSPLQQSDITRVVGLADLPLLEPGNWPDILAALKLTGVTQTLAANCQLVSASETSCVLKLAEHHASLWNSAHEERIARAISETYQQEMRITIEVGETDVETPAQRAERERAEHQARAVAEIESDENVQQLIATFNGTLDPNSIAPLKRTGIGE